MRALLQRVQRAEVRVLPPPPVRPQDEPGDLIGKIGVGIVALVGISVEDTPEDARYLAGRVGHLRIFADDAGRLNKSLLEVGGEVLSISQFTLYADVSGGRRPSFVRAAPPDAAEPLYHEFNRTLEGAGVPRGAGAVPSPHGGRDPQRRTRHHPIGQPGAMRHPRLRRGTVPRP